ncbi:MAG: hypothetical protein L0Y38_02500 [Methylococcaceae bacterium]|nr:hypothetical protein [Methylococcaceae bacterium]MCI0732677.1 hypothetical protein [Methylococcaceae bacterium]
MHVQKSSAYSAGLSAPYRNGTAGAGRRPDRKGPESLQPHNPIDSLSPASRTALESGGAGLRPIETRSLDERRLIESNPKLDRRARTAIATYESLQYQTEADERESVSRLLGIDLYV